MDLSIVDPLDLRSFDKDVVSLSNDLEARRNDPRACHPELHATRSLMTLPDMLCGVAAITNDGTHLEENNRSMCLLTCSLYKSLNNRAYGERDVGTESCQKISTQYIPSARSRTVLRMYTS